MSQIKNTKFQLRLSNEEKESLIQKSKKSRMNISQYILALNEQKKIYVIEGVPELVVELARIGSNINQIATQANSNNLVTEKQLEYILKRVGQIKKVMSEILKTMFDSEEEIEI